MSEKEFLAILANWHREQAEEIHRLIIEGARTIAEFRSVLDFESEREAIEAYLNELGDAKLVEERWNKGKNWKQSFDDTVTRLLFELEEVIIIADFLTAEELADVARDNYLKRSEYEVQRIVVTERTRIVNEQTRRNCLFYRYQTQNDNLVCVHCMAVEGKVFDAMDGVVGVNMPPMHPNCRCYIVPVSQR